MCVGVYCSMFTSANIPVLLGTDIDIDTRNKTQTQYTDADADTITGTDTHTLTSWELMASTVSLAPKASAVLLSLAFTLFVVLLYR